GGGLARAPHVAPALVALGVRAVLAESFAPGAAHELVEAGIVPLALATAAAARECAAGDEIEIADLPDALEPGRSIGARNLTRGRALPLKSALTPAERALLRAGGRVAQAAAKVAGSAGA
ncbi:MAG TPA: hypothetical protein VFK69_00700, partial [Candidatus Eisenbacteria bacterium]|nr:hypothetical protein [Candidatus Eisenbacteria bacterium]